MYNCFGATAVTSLFKLNKMLTDRRTLSLANIVSRYQLPVVLFGVTEMIFLFGKKKVNSE